ncbi:hypothetical protein ABZP36_017885 [Zizania latifolia]
MDYSEITEEAMTSNISSCGETVGARKNSPTSLLTVDSSRVFSGSSSDHDSETINGSHKNVVLVAIVASIGNLLQGWDNAAIAGAIIYINNNFNLQNEPMMEGLIVSMSQIGAIIITAILWLTSNGVGKRPMLCSAALLYLISGIIMFMASNKYMLLLARLVYGFGVGLAVIYAPLYISETAPTNIRELLNTLPQFNGSLGMMLSYNMVFRMSLAPNPNWRVMLGVLSIPSSIFLVLCIFYLPESPIFLVSKGRIKEANIVMKMLLGKKDVSSEMAFLIQGLEAGKDKSIENYMISHDSENFGDGLFSNEEITKLYGHKEGMTIFACPFKRNIVVVESGLTPIPSYLDPIVKLFDNMHDNILNTPSLTKFENRSSDEEQTEISLDLESQEEIEEQTTDYEDDNLHHSLLRYQASSMEGTMEGTEGSFNPTRQTQTGFQRIFLHCDISQFGQVVQATALVSEPSFHQSNGPAMMHPSKSSTKVQSWGALLEPGIKHALIVGVTMQILQQFAGISGILNYAPQILKQTGAGIIFLKLGISSSSASILISALTTLMMLPSIGVAMKLMDRFGRRSLLLYTIPVLIASLVVLVVVNVVNIGSMPQAIISTLAVIVYVCSFVMGFGPIPNVLCSEIFPAGVRDRCMSICTLMYWIVSIVVTYVFPMMLSSIRFVGVSVICAIVCIIALIFVMKKVPETKDLFAFFCANVVANFDFCTSSLGHQIIIWAGLTTNVSAHEGHVIQRPNIYVPCQRTAAAAAAAPRFHLQRPGEAAILLQRR